MAATISRYNSTARRLLNQDVNLDTLKIMLLNSDASFDASHVTLAGPAGAANANEVSGNGWTTGGELLSSRAVTTILTAGAQLDYDDPEVVATGGSISGVRYAVIYDDSDGSDAPLWFIDFDATLNADENAQFKLALSSNGLFRLTNAA